MAAALRLHQLQPGELPLYPIETPDFFYLHVGEDDLSASYWVQHLSPSTRRRAIIPLLIDLTFQEFAGHLRDWLLDLEDVCPEGTLIFSLRTSAVLDPVGRIIMAGLGCVPSGSIDGAIELHGEDPAVLIQQMCLQPGDGGEPFPISLDKEVRDLADDRARRLLETFLSLEQRAELEKTRAFHVQSHDGRLYRIRYRHQHNVDLIEDGRPTIRYCLVMKENVPIYDLMLGQKILLEKDPETFFRIANAQRLVEGTFP